MWRGSRGVDQIPCLRSSLRQQRNIARKAPHQASKIAGYVYLCSWPQSPSPSSRRGDPLIFLPRPSLTARTPCWHPRPAPPRPGRTEIITNDQNPNFTAQFSLTYLFEEVQRVRLEVYDVDTAYTSSDASKLDLGRQDFQGETKRETCKAR